MGFKAIKEICSMRYIFDDPKLNTIDPNEYSGITSYNIDLNGTKYSLSDLEFLIINASVCLRTILMTQNLTANFCKTYMRNRYASGDGDSDITTTEILTYQKHLSIDDFKSPISKN